MRDITDLASKAATQHGLLTNQQLIDAGLTPRERRDLVEKGVIERVRREVHRMAGSPRSWHQDALALALTPGPPLALSHRSGTRLWEWRTVDDELEITVRHPANRRIAAESDE